jgi:cytochrome c-type biogenesis protein CcmE
MKSGNQGLRIGVAMIIIMGVIAWLAITGVEANKSYYVTISELQNMGSKAYTRHLRVAGNVLPGTIHRDGTNANFYLVENDRKLQVAYTGEEPPPDTFKDNSQALAIGTFGHDGIFHATQLQAKCASKYAPKNAPGQPEQKASAVPATNAAAVVPTTAPAAR